MALLIGFINVLAIVAIIFYWYKRLPNSPINRYFIPALIFKIGAGLLLGAIYQFHYAGGDTLLYFQDAETLANLAYQSPVNYLKTWTGSAVENLKYADQPRALVIVKLISLTAIVTYKNYWLSSIYFSLFSFFGMWKLTTILSSIDAGFRYPAIIAFLFYPSVVFWSSGLLKEPVILGCLSLCMVIYLPYLMEHKTLALKHILLSLFLMFIIWQLKFYYAAIFVPLLFVCVTVTYFRSLSPQFRSNLWMQLLATILLPLLIYYPLSILHPLLSFENLLVEIVKNHDWYLVNGTLPQEGYIYFSDLRPKLISFIENFPLALFSGLFRPLLFDVNNLFQMVAGLENTVLLILFVAALLNIYKIKNSRFLYLFIITVLYIGILATFLAFAAPNFGTLMRYKTAFLPFLAYLVLINNPLLKLLKPKQLTKSA